MAENNVGVIYYEVDAKTDGLVNSEKELQRSAKKTQTELKKTEQAAKSMGAQMTKSAKGVKQATGALGVIGRKAGQAGVQFQQLVGQIQGGQDKFQAFAAQGADLGIVLGAPLAGVIFALSSAIVGSLIPALSGANDEMESIADNTDDFFERVQARLDETGKDTQLQANIITVETSKIAKQYERNIVSIQNYREEAALLNRTALVGDKTSRQLAASLRDQADELERENQVLAETAERLFDMGIEMKTFTGLTDNGSESAVKFRSATDVLADSIRGQIIQLTQGADAFEEYRIRQTLGLTEAEKLPPVIDEQITALRKLRQEQEAQKSAEKDAAKQALADDRFEKELAAQEKRLLSGEAKLRDSLEREKAIIDEAREKDLISEQEYRDRQRAISDQYYQGVMQMQQKVNENAVAGNEELTRTLESFTNQAAGAFARVVVGANTGKEAVKQLADSILNEAVGAIIRMGIEYVSTNATIEAADAARKTRNSAANAASVSAQVGQTAALAAQNAFAATAAIPIVGPGLAPSAAAAAGASASAIGSPAIGLAPVAGARQYGGGVQAGSTYRVNEMGTEGLMQSVGGRQYLTPLTGGRVVSAKDMQSMGSANITINNNAPGVDVVASQENNQVMINIAKREAAKVEQSLTRQMKTNQGPFYKSSVRGTNLEGRSTR